MDSDLVELLKNVPSLKYVKCYGCDKITGAFAREKESGKNLQEISLTLTGFSREYLADIITLPEMRFVSINGVRIFLKASASRGEDLHRNWRDECLR